MHTYIYMHIHIHAYIYLRIYTHIYIHTYIYIHTHTYIYINYSQYIALKYSANSNTKRAGDSSNLCSNLELTKDTPYTSLLRASYVESLAKSYREISRERGIFQIKIFQVYLDRLSGTK